MNDSERRNRDHRRASLVLGLILLLSGVAFLAVFLPQMGWDGWSAARILCGFLFGGTFLFCSVGAGALLLDGVEEAGALVLVGGIVGVATAGLSLLFGLFRLEAFAGRHALLVGASGHALLGGGAIWVGLRLRGLTRLALEKEEGDAEARLHPWTGTSLLFGALLLGLAFLFLFLDLRISGRVLIGAVAAGCVTGLSLALNTDRLISFFGSDRGRLGVRRILVVLLSVAAFLLVNGINATWGRGRFDLTQVGLYSLSERSRTLLDQAVDRPIDVHLIITPGTRLEELLRELVRRYEDATPILRDPDTGETRPALQFVWHHPDKDRDEVKDLVRRLKVPGLSAGVDRVILESMGRTKVLRRQDLVRIERRGPETRIGAFLGEDAFTRAILGLTRKETRIGVVTSHGALSPSGDLRIFTTQLKHEGFRIQSFSLTEVETIPEELDIVCFFGPTEAISKPDRELLEAWLGDGGSLLLALNPIIEREIGTNRLVARSPGFDSLLAGYGIRERVGLLIGRIRTVMGTLVGPSFVVPTIRHPITEPLDEAHLALAESMALDAADPAKPIALSDAGRSWLVEDLEGYFQRKGDLDTAYLAELAEGPFCVAASSRRTEAAGRSSRVVVLANAAVGSDALIREKENYPILLRSVLWLSGQQRKVLIPPKDPDPTRLDPGDEGRFRVIMILIAGPLLLLIGGIGWILRGRR